MSFLLDSQGYADSIFVEAESFHEKGGWVVDQQFMDIKSPGEAGSVILLAHGMGKPVANAKTTVTLPKPGTYQVFVRTRNWVSPWMPADLSDEARARDWAPGKFRLVLNGKPSEITLGIYGSGWCWQKAGSVTVSESELGVRSEELGVDASRNASSSKTSTAEGVSSSSLQTPNSSLLTPNSNQVSVELEDLTGFDGRVDALYFTTDPAETCALPDDPEPLDLVRCEERSKLGVRSEELGIDASRNADSSKTSTAEGTSSSSFQTPHSSLLTPNSTEYDLVVVGGGIAGTCAACSAAQLGLKVALIQDRPVLGGNASNEIRIPLEGLVNLPPYPNVGNLVYKMGPLNAGYNRGPIANQDDARLAFCRTFETLDVFLSTHVTKVVKNGTKIESVVGKNIESGAETTFHGKLFADCTGDGTLGVLAGADWRMGREPKSETGEPTAPETADDLTMGASCLWYSVPTDHETTFPELPWAHQFVEEAPGCFQPTLEGAWNWEVGLRQDQIQDFERIRDNALRAAYGHWSHMKNHATGSWAERVKKRELGWLAYICGKRESRRLMGDVILCEQDITSNRKWEDACVPCTWQIDLHYPDPKNMKYFPNSEFKVYAINSPKPSFYAIPYRTLYSRNVENLFMAGRNISVTHVALGMTRVMRTCGMMGEVVGMAAAVCRKYDCAPRAVYTDHLKDLITHLETGVAEQTPEMKRLQTPRWLPTAGINFARGARVKASSEFESGEYPVWKINDGTANIRDDSGRWVSARSKGDETEAWVEFTWDEPVTFNACRVVTGVGGWPVPVKQIGNFWLQTFQNGEWVNVPGGSVEGNECCDLGLTFEPVTTDRLRLFIRTPGDLARVWELELYKLQ